MGVRIDVRVGRGEGRTWAKAACGLYWAAWCSFEGLLCMLGGAIIGESTTRLAVRRGGLRRGGTQPDRLWKEQALG